jgi:hypothetical protein
MALNMEGVVFIATGADYTRAATAAATSVRKLMPGVPIDLFTDTAEPDGPFEQVHRIDAPHRRSKVDCLPRTRFENTLYLDTDVRLVADVRDLFELMARFDLAIAHAHSRRRPQTNEVWRTKIPACFPQLNGGVFVYRRSERMLRLLEDWRTGFHEAGFRKDQVVLRELVWTSDIDVFNLPPEYNVRYEKYLSVWGPEEAEAKILHFARFHGAAADGPRLPAWKRLLPRRYRS